MIWNLILQISSALDYLHKRNVIHRDVKPANILKDNQGQFKLSDMGVSKILAGGDLAKTKIGSLSYSAP
jgi:serine/threonine protein kinase